MPIILPIELRHRELTSRLATAVHLVAAGATVILGQQWAIFNNIAFWPKSVILFKTLNAIQASNMERFKQAGHIVAAMDEEVMTYRSNFARTIAPNAFADLFLAQSEPHARELRARSLFNNIAITGNPRAEMFDQFKSEAEIIKNQHGPFILFNTNYPTINSIWGDAEKVYEISAQAGHTDRAEHGAWVKWETENREAIIATMDWAKARRKIMVRSHPGEVANYWGRDVIKDSHPIPWILAAELVVHTGCTTGIEAALCGVPVLNIETSPNPVAERITPLINLTVTNWEEAAAAINDFWEGRATLKSNDDSLERYFPNHKLGRAAENIARELLKLCGPDIAPTDWRSHNRRYQLFGRSENDRKKFTATEQEIATLFGAAQKRAGLTTKATVTEIDDGVFVVEKN